MRATVFFVYLQNIVIRIKAKSIIVKFYKHLIAFLTVLSLPCFSVPSVAKERFFAKTTTDSLWTQLSLASTKTDSIEILYNLYDLNSAVSNSEEARKDNIWILSHLYDVASRQNDEMSTFEALRGLASSGHLDGGNLDLQLRRLKQYPGSVQRRETESFLKLQNYFKLLRDSTLTESDRQQHFSIVRREAELSKNRKDLYDRLDQQFALVLFGSNLIHPELLDKYLLDLRRYVEMTEDKTNVIRSYYYRIAAILYDDAGEGAKSLEAHRSLLKLLDKREEELRKQGRIYKNFDALRFGVLRMMLSHYADMSPDSVALIHKELLELEKSLPKGQVTDLEKRTVRAMWNMHFKKYDEALKDLRVIIASKRYRDRQSYILAYIEAASAVNALNDIKEGQNRYIEILMDRARDAADAEYARMRIEYEIDTLEASTDSAREFARAAGRQTAKVSNQYLRYGIVALGVFLLSLVILQIVANRRRKRVAQKLLISNNELKLERDRLQVTKHELEQANEKAREAVRKKVEFIHNVSHEISEPARAIVGFTQLITDSIPEERRRYLQKFIDVLQHNCEILEQIVSDILDSTEVEENTVTTIEVTHFSLEERCKLVAQTFIPRLNENQTLIVENLQVIGSAPSDDYGVDTDSRRLEQILINLVSNAIKFCPKGEITISPVIDYEHGIFSVAVTDQGPGIPPGKENIVFERFEKLGHFAEGLGLGLFVCKQLAHLLGGDVVVDTEHGRGARFVVTLPLNFRPEKLAVK